MPTTKHTTNARATETTGASHLTPDPRKEAPRVGDEGEPQTKYLFPAEGGSYTKGDDGTLRRAHKPTEVPEYAPITDAPNADGHHFVRDNDKGELKRVPAVPKTTKE
jgi:hypothetical protein